MRRTYILVDKWSFMPRKDRRLTVFMLVRIICLKEKGQNIGLHLFFKPDASSCWHLCQLQLSVGEILLQGIKNFNLSRVVVTKVVLSFYFVCLT